MKILPGAKTLHYTVTPHPVPLADLRREAGESLLHIETGLRLWHDFYFLQQHK